MKVLAFVFVCLFGVLQTEASPICQPTNTMANFDMDRFLGTWYWTLNTPNFYSKRGDTCPISILHKRDNGTYAHVLKYIKVGENHYRAMEGTVWHCSPNKTDGTMMIRNQSPASASGFWEARWWILGTDYENYAASWGCWTGPGGADRNWLMAWCRQKICPEEHRNTMRRIFEESNLDASVVVDVEQDTCPSP